MVTLHGAENVQYVKKKYTIKMLHMHTHNYKILVKNVNLHH